MKNFRRKISAFLAFLAVLSVPAAADVPAAPAENSVPTETSSQPSEQTDSSTKKSGGDDALDALISSREHDAQVAALREVLARRDALFAEAETLPGNEFLRRAADIAERFSALCSRFPDSVAALYFYAEFLRDGGESESAEALLLKAEKIEPEFAPAQFLLAEIYAARGEAEKAFPRFAAAVYAEPGRAHWRGIFGEFLVASRDRLLAAKCFESRAELDAKMQSEFLVASALEPENFDALWRYAESFYDAEAPDWSRALVAWDRVARKIPSARRDALVPAVRLHRARALVELGKFEEADTILRETAGVPGLERSRRKVFEILVEKRKKR